MLGSRKQSFPTEGDIDLPKGCDIIRRMETATNYRYIVKTEGVRGGNARIEGTRIGVHDVVAYFLLGRDVDGIRAAFPDLSRRKSSSASLTTKIIKLKSSDWRCHKSTNA